MAGVRKAYWRIRSYYQHHGAMHTVKRLGDSVRRMIFLNRDVIYSMDLADWPSRELKSRESYFVERIDREADIPEKFLKSVGEQQSEEMFKDYLKRRLEKGASLWCFGKEKEYLGYFWVFIGRTMKPHYIPLLAKDVHIFDGFIFPGNRGQGEMAIMMDLVVDRLKSMGLRRAYIETAEWNASSRKFIEKMGYAKIGCAKQRYRRGKNVVTWWLE